jgi:2C-methyl-D-erythritol 2,4-cyclodiphosphate synthase
MNENTFNIEDTRVICYMFSYLDDTTISIGGDAEEKERTFFAELTHQKIESVVQDVKSHSIAILNMEKHYIILQKQKLDDRIKEIEEDIESLNNANNNHDIVYKYMEKMKNEYQLNKRV